MGVKGVKACHGLPFFQIIIIIADVVNQGLPGKLQNPGGGLVDKVTIMGHIENCAGVALQGML